MAPTSWYWPALSCQYKPVKFLQDDQWISTRKTNYFSIWNFVFNSYGNSKLCENGKLTMELDDKRSLSNSRTGRKKGKVCSITIIFSRNDLLSKTQWKISQGSPAKIEWLCSYTIGNHVFRDLGVSYHVFSSF